MLYDSRILKGVFMKRFTRFLAFLSILLLSFSQEHAPTAMAGSPPAEEREVILKAADITPKIFPERVFFRGQSAPVQFRNTGGVHFADDLYVLAGMVDSSGYSAAIKEKYQAYLLNEVSLEIGGQTLKPGAYGIGFLNGAKFVVMDLGANDVLQEGTGSTPGAITWSSTAPIKSNIRSQKESGRSQSRPDSFCVRFAFEEQVPLP
jgi:hypothetical protein